MPELTPFLLYLLMQADSVKGLFIALTIVSFLIGFAAFMCWADSDAPFWPVRTAIITSAMSLILAVLTPSTNTVLVMYGVPAAIQAAQGLQLDDTAKRGLDALNRFLDNIEPEDK